MSQSENTAASTINKTWEYNGSTFDFDLGDADDLERYEIALQHLEESEKARKKDGTPSEIARAYDKLFRDFYDELFGDGAGDAILGEKRSISNCDDSFESFYDFSEAQSTALRERREKITSKYSGNRAQRRNTSYRRG